MLHFLVKLEINFTYIRLFIADPSVAVLPFHSSNQLQWASCSSLNFLWLSVLRPISAKPVSFFQIQITALCLEFRG